MKKKNELSYKDLRVTCNPEIFKFADTSELEATNTEIGQERGIKALEFGVNVDIKGYNIYLEGPSGVGKTMYAKNYLDTISMNAFGWAVLSYFWCVQRKRDFYAAYHWQKHIQNNRTIKKELTDLIKIS